MKTSTDSRNLYRMRIHVSFEDSSKEAAHWLQECFSKVFFKHASELALRGAIQFEELYYKYYVKVSVEGPLAKLWRLQAVIKKFQSNQPIYKLKRMEFSQPEKIPHYHYHQFSDKYAMWYGKNE